MSEEQVILTCSECGEALTDDHEVICGENFCDYDCANNAGYHSCANCSTWSHEDNMRYVEANGELYCNSYCANRDGYQRCERCGEFQNVDWFYSVYTPDGCEQWCESCADYNTHDCWDCGDRCEEGYHCCGEPDDDECEYNGTGQVHGYGYKPSPNFMKITSESKGEKLFHGFELELDWVRPSNFSGYINHGDTAGMLHERTDGVLYCKSDCTCNAFEMVTHPFSFEWWKKNRATYMEIWKELVKLGYRSFQAENSGMHIHMSLDAFKNSQLLKFMDFFYRPENRNFITGISQRRESRLNQWSTLNVRDEIYRYEALHKNKNSGRSVAVNITRATAEVRLFRGTLHPVSFQKNIEFVNSAYHFARETGLRKTHFEDYLNWIEGRKEYSNVHTFMANSERFNSMMNGSAEEGS